MLANSFLMPRGYTIAWSGWDVSAGTDNSDFNTTVTVPVAKHRNGATITGPSYEYIVTGGASAALFYAAASLDKNQAKLTHRVHLDDVPATVPGFGTAACTPATATCWDYNGDRAIRLVTGAGVPKNFTANDIYEFAFTAKDPTVNGLGFAAVRDWMEFLRYDNRDDHGNRNPLAGHIKRVYTEISSQPGRFLNDFRHLGFNETEGGKKAFDGHMNWISAGNGINLNYRFSNPAAPSATGRTTSTSRACSRSPT